MATGKNLLNFRLFSHKLPYGITITHILLFIILSLLIVTVALPGYFNGGRWSWQTAPKVAHLQPVKELKDKGINLADWKTVGRSPIKLGENQWLVQVLEQPNQPPIQLFLLPQTFNANQPGVEWTDLKSIENLQEESEQVLTFKASVPGSEPVKARFFKGFERNTYAVVQWYAWPKGGHYKPFYWFVGDQLARLHRSRLPWVAVSLKIPMSPLKDLKSMQPLAQKLAESVQTTLEKEVFSLVYSKQESSSNNDRLGEKNGD